MTKMTKMTMTKMTVNKTAKSFKMSNLGGVLCSPRLVSTVAAGGGRDSDLEHINDFSL